MARIILFLTAVLVLTSCSNYRLLYRKNPLGMYGINSVSIPMFFNKSNIPNTAPIFTREFYKYLSSFQNLKIYSGINPKADAVLLGIIDSPKSIRDTISVTDTKFTSTVVEETDIGVRRDFFTPTQNQVNLVLRLVLIKNPTSNDIKAFQGNLPKGKVVHPKVIFNEEITLQTAFDRELRAFSTEQKEGVTNFTNNQGNLRKLVENMAVQGRDYFKDLIIYAF